VHLAWAQADVHLRAERGLDPAIHDRAQVAPIGSMMSTVAVRLRSSGSEASSKARGRIPMVTSAPGASRWSARASGSAMVCEPALKLASFGLAASTVASIRFICGVPMNPATNRLAGRAKISCGVAICSIRPARITAIRSAMVSASS
jgi:hypothetical protein